MIPDTKLKTPDETPNSDPRSNHFNYSPLLDPASSYASQARLWLWAPPHMTSWFYGFRFLYTIKLNHHIKFFNFPIYLMFQFLTMF